MVSDGVMMKAKVTVVLELTAAVGQAIKQLGEVPNGYLYARLMGTLSLEEYTAIINALVRARLVRKSNNLLTWIGPA